MKSYNNLPEVSIVITCYNYARYLPSCLDSVINQTFRDFEIIVVDDGSTDQTPVIVKKERYKKLIRYIYQNNRGQANAKNAGINSAKGKYIAFLDADDCWEPDKLEKQLPLFTRQNVGVVYSRARYIDSFGHDLDLKLSLKYLQPRRGRVTDYLIMDNFIPFSSSVIRRDCLDRFGAFNELYRMGIDWDLWLRISTEYEFDYVDLPLLMYRIGHAGQMSKNVEERQRCSDRIMKNFAQSFPTYIKKNVLRKALAYTFSNRGDYQSKRNIPKALRYYLRSFLYWPLTLEPMKRASKALLKKIIY